MKRALLLGCGTARARRIQVTPDEPLDFTNFDLVTADMDPNCGATIICDLPWELPHDLRDQPFDEIHAYDSLEHWGVQGDWRAWIDEMAMYHDMLKPSGRFFAIVPIGGDWFADPGHTRFISGNWFNVLCNDYYEERAANGIEGGDYRWYWKRNFRRIAMQTLGEPPHHLAVVLEKA